MTKPKQDLIGEESGLKMDALRAKIFKESVEAALICGENLPKLMRDCLALWETGKWPDGTKAYRDSSRLVALRALIGTIPEKMLAKMMQLESAEVDKKRTLKVNIVLNPVGGEVIEAEEVDE